MSRLVDLSHTIEDGMPVYPGIPAPVIGAIVDHESSRHRYEGKAEFLLGTFDLPGNTGTYLDSPFHRFREGEDLASISLARIAGVPAVVVDAPAEHRPIEFELDEEALRGRAVLVRTRWDLRWGTEAYWEPGPFFSEDGAERLARLGPSLVGVDFANVDDTGDLSRPAHTTFLGAGVVIVEHLTGLDALPPRGFTFSAVPPRIVRGASFPVRAFAEVPSGEEVGR
ncbi:MAG TPA: cyclase family protein [Actinomycetota bacterium]|nr:cyclase family protein [Actinomycetota bacterium]